MRKTINVNCLRRIAFSIIATLSILTITPQAIAGFTAFEIRNTPTIIDNGGSMEFIIDGGGDKAGLGSNDINGSTLGDIVNLHIDRLDDRTRFALSDVLNQPLIFHDESWDRITARIKQINLYVR